MDLPVVQEFVPVHALEAVHLEKKLRKIRRLFLVLTEKHFSAPAVGKCTKCAPSPPGYFLTTAFEARKVFPADSLTK